MVLGGYDDRRGVPGSLVGVYVVALDLRRVPCSH